MKIKKQKVLRGLAFRYPNGALSTVIVASKDDARSNAAFASVRNYSNSIYMPNDWKRAYKQGFRIVRVVMRVEKRRAK